MVRQMFNCKKRVHSNVSAPSVNLITLQHNIQGNYLLLISFLQSSQQILWTSLTYYYVNASCSEGDRCKYSTCNVLLGVIAGSNATATLE